MEQASQGINESKFPIFYSNDYNISFMKFEKLHTFDAGKWGRIFNFLKEMSRNTEEFRISEETIMTPVEVTQEDLLLSHSDAYLKSLKWSKNVAAILEVFFIAAIPNYFVNSHLLRRFRIQTGGTAAAAKAALQHDWAINIGGGFHHAHSNGGSGFCVYADITLAIKKLQTENPSYKFLIVDLDAHQGNGHERDFKKDDNVFILDMYNKHIFPKDEDAKEGINIKVELKSYTEDKEYMDLLKSNLDRAFTEFPNPNLLVYNAGTDSLDGDPLGRLALTENGIKERDQFVFSEARRRKCPIIMVTSGGYQRTNAQIIANSIWNLFQRNLIGPRNSFNIMSSATTDHGAMVD